ncbi:unnamed protein product, partial [Hymenolepis diminuta]
LSDIFPEILSIRILYDDASICHSRSRNDVFHVSMKQNPYLSFLKVPIDCPLSMTATFHLKVHFSHISHFLTRPYPNDSYKVVFIFPLKTKRLLVGCRLLRCPLPYLLFFSSLPSPPSLPPFPYSLPSSLWPP